MELNITIDKDWLEATWTEDEIQIHCESFSGHIEHIAMLRNKASEYGTSLEEYEDLIKQCEDRFVYPTEDELAKEELQNKIQEANQYLAQTDWANSYKIRHDLGLEVLQEDSTKWLTIKQREEHITFLKGAK